MISNLNEREIDPLALALTRTPMFMGVNVKVFFINLMVSALVCLHFHTFWGIAFFLMVHVVLMRCSIKEPDYLYLRTKAFIKTPPVLNFWYWGKVNSYEPK